LTELLGHNDGLPHSIIKVVTPAAPHVIGASSVAAVVEDYVFSNIKSQVSFLSQIALYHVNEEGKLNKVEIFQQQPIDSGFFSNLDKTLKQYYEAVNSNKKSNVKPFYASNHVIHDPVGIDARTFDAVYDKAFSAHKFHITAGRVYSSLSGRAILTFGEFDYNGKQFTSSPIQVFHFDSHSKIVSFDAYFVARHVDFS